MKKNNVFVYFILEIIFIRQIVFIFLETIIDFSTLADVIRQEIDATFAVQFQNLRLNKFL